jgi:hypothetical protein
MELQRTAGNQAVLRWLTRCQSVPDGTSESSTPTPTVQREVLFIEQEGDKGRLYYSSWQQQAIDKGLSTARLELFSTEKEATAADQRWRAFYQSQASAREPRSVGSGNPLGFTAPTLTELKQVKSRLRHEGELSVTSPPPLPERSEPRTSPSVVPEKPQGQGGGPPRRPPPPPPERSEPRTSPSVVPERPQGQGGGPPRRPLGRGLAPRPLPIPSMQSGSSSHLRWKDLEPALRSDLEDVWTQHRKKPFGSWNDLYSNWYKVSKKAKDGPHGGEYSQAVAKNVSARIYINVTPEGERQVYAWVKETLASVSGVADMKSGGPDLAAWARDVIVIYVSQSSAVDAVIETLKGCPLRKYFVDELVRSTRGVIGLPGVGIGADPPYVDELQEEYLQAKDPQWTQSHDIALAGRPSFSEYRARLIFQALAEAGTDQDRFHHLVIQGFVQAGISPTSPSEQGTPSPSVLERLGLVTEKPRIDAEITSTEEKTAGEEVFHGGNFWVVIKCLGTGEPYGPRKLTTYVYQAFRYE